MSSDDHKQRMADAIQQALDSRAGNLLVIARSYLPDLSNTGYMERCPYCEKRGKKFSIKRAGGGHWYWGCYNPSCPANFDTLKANRMADTIGFIAMREGCDRDKAVDVLLDITNTPNPRHSLDKKPKVRKKKQAAKKTPAAEPAPVTADEVHPPADPPGEKPPETKESPSAEPAPTERNDTPEVDPDFSLTSDPDQASPAPPEQPTVWEDLYARLTLTASDREVIKRTRGLNKESIDAAGYRSSIKNNRDALAPLLDAYPIGLLLSEGIVTKDTETGKIKINSQLCGWGLKKRGTSKDPEEWDWTNPILIPYRNKEGKVIGIRPHKGNLSGKSYMREQGFEHGFRSTRTRSKLYTSFLFWNRPEGWEKKCVLTEGEHKANALAQCGIPACAVPGIQMPRNQIFLEEMIDVLRDAGIRDVIVAFDNEDKSHKPDPWDRYDVEVYALFTCDALRSNGFLPAHCILPEEWRVDGKADWDGALLQFKAGAEGKFKAALKKAKPYFPQQELFGNNERDRIVNCKLNRLRLTPQILTGGDEEEELARLILKTKSPWRQEFQVRDLAQQLFSTRGCYYIHQKPTKDLLFGTKAEPGLYSKAADIRKEMNRTPPDELEAIAALEAALAACNLLIRGKPEILTDFTIQCEFQVRTQEGEVHRLFRFRNKHGQASNLVQVPPSALSTSSKFREYCMGVGNFNPMLGDKHLQMLMQDIGYFSAWREIRALSTLGRDTDSNLWIFGDCAFNPDADLYKPLKPGENPDVIFADKHDVIWHDGIGYRVDPEELSSFAHYYPPKFFVEIGKEPAEIYAEIKNDPDKERIACARILLQLAADLICTFGDSSGLLVLGGILSYAMAPELLAKYHGHPGIWIHGRQYSGKSETSRFLMQIWGYPVEYKTFVLSGGTTAAFIDRTFAQYCDIPIHADEFRQREADDTRIASLRAPFNRQSKGKAMMDQSNRTRLVNPKTSPVVTGEGVTKDAATLSRYIEAILATDKRIGSKKEQSDRYNRMLAQSKDYHRIIRFILLNRKSFGAKALQTLDEFIHKPDVAEQIKSDRIRTTYGTAYASFKTIADILIGNDGSTKVIPDSGISQADLSLLVKHNATLEEFTVEYAQRAADDVLSINFIVKFWTDVVTFIGISHTIGKFIRFERCMIDADNKVTVAATKTDQPGIIRCVLIKANELYAEYQKEARSRGYEPDLSQSNIKSECQNEAYWVPAPKSQKRQAHRMTIEGLGQVDVWVLRTDRMDSTLQDLFNAEFEREDEPPMI